MNTQNLTGRDVRIFKDTPVWDAAIAIRDNDTLKLRQLLKGQPKSILEFKEPFFGQTLLNWSVYRDSYSSVKVLANLGADPNIKANDSTSAIINAADKFDTSYLELMIKIGGDVNAIANIDEPQRIRTPIIASAGNCLESVRILVNNGANANYIHRTTRGNIGGENIQSALISSCSNNRIDIVKYLLIDVGIDFNYVFSTTLEGKPQNILYYLRNMPFELNSEQHKIKMEVVAYLKNKGLDYCKEPLPDGFDKNYDADYLSKY